MYVGLVQLAQTCAKLEHIDLSWCPSITRTGVESLCSSCHRLNYVGLMRCAMITDPVADCLVELFPHISFSTTTLDLRRLMLRAIEEGTAFPRI